MARIPVALVILLLPLSATAVTFQTLTEADLAEGEDIYRQLLPSAQAGHPASQWVIANRIYRDRRYDLATDLLLDLYRNVGFDFPEGLDPRGLLEAYADLGELLLEPGKGNRLDPEFGLELLTRSARLGSASAARVLSSHLRSSSVLPYAEAMARAWAIYAGMEPTEEDELYPGPPPADAFGPCDNMFGRVDEILRLYREAQRRILEDASGGRVKLTDRFPGELCVFGRGCS